MIDDEEILEIGELTRYKWHVASFENYELRIMNYEAALATCHLPHFHSFAGAPQACGVCPENRTQINADDADKEQSLC